MKRRQRNEPKRETQIAMELLADADLWRRWWDTFGRNGLKATDIAAMTGAFADRDDSRRAVMVGVALAVLARRRIIVGLRGEDPVLARRHIVHSTSESTRLVIQSAPNEIDPRRAGRWRLWPVPASSESRRDGNLDTAGPPASGG